MVTLSSRDVPAAGVDRLTRRRHERVEPLVNGEARVLH